MSGTSLRRLLEIFEDLEGTFSIPYLAKELGVTAERAESLVEFWVRKGRIRVSNGITECESCGVRGECPLAFELPKVYELVDSDGDDEQNRSVPCSF